jgi:hypothetical protein
MMRVGVRAGAALVALGLVIAAGQAFAAGSAPLPPPDPTAKNLTPAQIQKRAFDACLPTQARLKEVTQESVRAGCQCYASRTIRAMTKAEIQAFRDTGYFNDSARAKAFEAVDRCKLARPV